MLGVIIGSTAIVLVVTIVSTGKDYISKQIQGIGANIAYVSLQRSGTLTRQEDELTPDDLTALRQPSLAWPTLQVPTTWAAISRLAAKRIMRVWLG